MPKQADRSSQTAKPKTRSLKKAAVKPNPRKHAPTMPEGAMPFLASKVTARSQTTLPSGVRKALGLRAGDQIAYQIEQDQVIIRKVTADEEDPALDGFLALLEDDIAANKERVVFATRGFAAYLEDLTAGIEVDYDAPIEGEFEI
ncbi:MAG TPA: type II toxin-antitoxin system PrlF family antitoxin [Longimicrobium sp.]|uniref:type II toxin-antitoxin system PrlF family antitoxin n=1 Tax=Longimicrobium sp. TaxID=2029185 RepID=UPI002ED8C2A3